MSAEDPNWGPPQRPAQERKRKSRSESSETPAGEWENPERPQPPRPLFGEWLANVPYEKVLVASLAIVAGASAAIAVVVVRPDTARPAVAVAPRAVVAIVTLAHGDTRSLDDVCQSFDVPSHLCDLSRTCVGRLAATAPQTRGGRAYELILRSQEGTCAGQPRPQTHSEDVRRNDS